MAAQHLGFKMSPPAYLHLSLRPLSSFNLLRGRGGVNYASGGSGILDITVSESIITFAEILPLNTSTSISKVETFPMNILFPL